MARRSNHIGILRAALEGIRSVLHAEAGLPSRDIGTWRSLAARSVRDAEVVGSNPTVPTRFLSS